MAVKSQARPTTRSPHFATLLVMALAPEEVGKRIADARKRAGYAHHQDFADAISERLGHRVNLRTVQRWQKGRDPKTGQSWLPRLPTLMEIADLLGEPRSYFVEDEAPETDSQRMAPLLGELEVEVYRLRHLNDELEAELAPARPGRKRRVP